MPTTLMFKKTGGFHNALSHEVARMEKDGWEIFEKEAPINGTSMDYAIYKAGRARAVKVCDTEEDAMAYIDRKFGSMEGITVQERPRK